jgi:hypothetical protein
MSSEDQIPVVTENTDDFSKHLVQGSSKALTLLTFAALGVAVALWSLVLPVVGILYLVGVLQ